MPQGDELKSCFCVKLLTLSYSLKKDIKSKDIIDKNMLITDLYLIHNIYVLVHTSMYRISANNVWGNYWFLKSEFA